jgi:SAM-dependent methyltransferase
MVRSETPDVESSSTAYARRFAGPVGEWFLACQESATRALVGDRLDGLRVLDVGGGHGQLLPFLSQAGCEVTVVGSAPEPPPAMRPWAGHARVTYVAGHLLALPFAERQFDVVFSYRMLAHLERWDALIVELCRVSARRVVVDYPSSRSVNRVSGLLFGAKQTVEADTRPFQVFPPATIAAAFAEQGFATLSEHGQFFLPMAMHRALGVLAASRLSEGVTRALGLRARWGSPRIACAERGDAIEE